MKSSYDQKPSVQKVASIQGNDSNETEKAKQKYNCDKHAKWLKQIAVGDVVMMLDGS